MKEAALGSAPRQWREYVWLFIALAVAGLCRFWDLTGQSLFIDEGFVFHISEHAPREILALVAHTDFHPPLFYLITHALTSALGWPLWDYRYLTAAVSLAGVAATWAIARSLFGSTAAAIAGLAVALDPALIEWDRLYRMYALLVALGAVSWWLLLRAQTSGRAQRVWWWLAYAVAAITLPYIHYIGALVVASQAVYALTRVRLLWPALLGQCAAAVALVPWLWAVRIQYPNGGLVKSLHAADFSVLALIREVFVEGIPLRWMTSGYFDAIFVSATLLVIGYGIWLGRRTLLPYWFLPVVAQIVLSLATGKNLIIPRYLYVYVPACCICLGAVAAHLLTSKYRLGAIAILAGYLAVAAVAVPNMLFDRFYQFPDWYRVNAQLLQYEHKDDVIVLDQGAEFWVVYKFTGFRGHEIDAPAIPSDIPRTIAWLQRFPTRRIWYIENQPAFTDPNLRIEQYLDATRPILGAWHDPRLYREDIVWMKLYGPARLPAGSRSKRVVKTTSP